ncbi:UPF0182 family protein, partial [Microbacterium sp. P5_E9]
MTVLQRSMSMRSPGRSGTRLRGISVSVAAVIVALFVVGRITGVLIDWLWFSSVGYVGVFLTIFVTRVLLFVAVFAISAGAIWVSGWLAHRYASQSGTWKVGPAFPPGTPGV